MYMLRFDFTTSNNEAEYEALIAGIKLAQHLGLDNSKAYRDSKLVANQVNGSYEVRQPHLQKYLEKVNQLVNRFKTLTTNTTRKKVVYLQKLSTKRIRRCFVATDLRRLNLFQQFRKCRRQSVGNDVVGNLSLMSCNQCCKTRPSTRNRPFTDASWKKSAKILGFGQTRSKLGTNRVTRDNSDNSEKLHLKEKREIYIRCSSYFLGNGQERQYGRDGVQRQRTAFSGASVPPRPAFSRFMKCETVQNASLRIQGKFVFAFRKLLFSSELRRASESLLIHFRIRKHGLSCRHVASASMVFSADMLHPQAWSLPQTCYFRNMVVSASEPVLSCELIRIRMSCELIHIRIFRTRLANMSCSVSA
ncbi:hypothetical protein LXL04_022431 [Taraxacum kok-saghyz]